MNLIQWLNRLFSSKNYSTLLNLFGQSYVDNLYGSGYNPSSSSEDGSTIGRGLSDKFLGTNFLSQQAADVAYQREKELQDRNFAFQQQQWEQTNAYNSPANQMSRLREAGLNPHLAYGNPISEAQPMSGASASAPMASGSGAVGSIFDLISIPKRLELLDAQTEDYRASARKKNTDADDTEVTRGLRLKELETIITQRNAEIKDIISKIEQRIHQNKLTDTERYNISFEQMYKNNQLALDTQRLSNETNLTTQQIENLKADYRKTLAEAKVSEREFYEMVHTFAIRKSGLANQVNLSAAKISEAYATAAKLGLEGERVQQLLDLAAGDSYIAKALSDEAQSGGFKGVTSTAIFLFRHALSSFGQILSAIK